jgi:hypothetical protein
VTFLNERLFNDIMDMSMSDYGMWNVECRYVDNEIAMRVYCFLSRYFVTPTFALHSL